MDKGQQGWVGNAGHMCLIFPASKVVRERLVERAGFHFLWLIRRIRVRGCFGFWLRRLLFHGFLRWRRFDRVVDLLIMFTKTIPGFPFDQTGIVKIANQFLGLSDLEVGRLLAFLKVRGRDNHVRDQLFYAG